jgi:putative component of toxin-antitoxin plasmid stabilization module
MSKKLKLTRWFPGEVKPVRKGVYEKRLVLEAFNGNRVFQYWNGRYWCVSHTHVDIAFSSRIFKSDYQDGMWRGVAK